MADQEFSIGDVDVTNKDDLEKLVQEIQKKEKCIHLLGRPLSCQYPGHC